MFAYPNSYKNHIRTTSKTAKCNYNFLFLETWRNSAQFFGSLGHVVYHRVTDVLCNASSCVWLCQGPGDAECVSQGKGLWEPAGLAQRICTARPGTAASLGEQLGSGVSQVIWMTGIFHVSLLGSLSAPVTCRVTWLCSHGKGGGSSWLFLLSVDLATP